MHVRAMVVGGAALLAFGAVPIGPGAAAPVRGENRVVVNLDWERAPDLPQGRGGCATGWVGDRLVLAGGSFWEAETKRWSSRVDGFDPKTRTWESLPPLPVPVSDAACASDGRVLYLAGGAAEGIASRACRRLRRTEGRWGWEALPELPEERTYAAAALVGRQLVLIGGCADPNDLTRTTTEVLALDVGHPEKGWQRQAALPGPARCLSAAAVLDGRAFLFGGCRMVDGRVTNLTDALRYDPRRDRWTALPPLPRALRASAAAAIPNGRIGLFGGYSGGPDLIARLGPAFGFERRVLVYDPSSRQYAEGTPLPRALADMDVVAQDGVLFGAGGEDRARSRSDWLLQGRLNRGAVAPQATTILALGDSVTAGVGRSGVTAADTYPRLLEQRLAARGMRASVVNSGVGGENTAQALQRLHQVFGSLPRIDVAIVMYGLNDAAMIDAGPREREAPRVPATEYARNLQDLLAELRRQGARPILCTSNPMSRAYVYADRGAYGRDADINVEVRRHAATARRVAEEAGVPLVDIFELFEKGLPSRTLLPDGLHPGPAGQAQIAEVLEPVVARAIGVPSQ